MGFKVLGFGLGSSLQGAGFLCQGCRVKGVGSGVEGLKVSIWGLGFVSSGLCPLLRVARGFIKTALPQEPSEYMALRIPFKAKVCKKGSELAECESPLLPLSSLHFQGCMPF